MLCAGNLAAEEHEADTALADSEFGFTGVFSEPGCTFNNYSFDII